MADKLGPISAVALAAAVILAYSLWGASILSAQRAAQAGGTPAQQLALGK